MSNATGTLPGVVQDVKAESAEAPANHKRDWRDWEKGMLIDLLLEGIGYSELAITLKRSTVAVKAELARLLDETALYCPLHYREKLEKLRVVLNRQREMQNRRKPQGEAGGIAEMARSLARQNEATAGILHDVAAMVHLMLAVEIRCGNLNPRSLTGCLSNDLVLSITRQANQIGLDVARHGAMQIKGRDEALDGEDRREPTLPAGRRAADDLAAADQQQRDL